MGGLFNKKAVILGVVISAVLIGIAGLSGGLTAHRAADILFVLGVLLTLPGLISLVRRLGAGELFAFSWGRMRHVLHKQKHGESGEFPASYFEYLGRKKQNTQEFIISLSVGLILVAVSFILAVW